jgi:hypothetical protein
LCVYCNHCCIWSIMFPGKGAPLLLLQSTTNFIE